MQKANKDSASTKDHREEPDMKPMHHYARLAKVFAYPERGYVADVATCAAWLKRDYPSAYAQFERFADFIASGNEIQAEEIYAKTFHVQAICYLDLGYVLFGEDYKRGEFLVHMKDEQARAGNDCGTELPDNLACVLQLMSMTQDEAFREELAVKVVLPSLERMIAEFDEARIQMKEKVLRKLHNAILLPDLEGGNIYRNALGALEAVIRSDFRVVDTQSQIQQPSLGGAFLKNCSGGGCSTDPLQAPVKQDLSVGML